MKCVKINLRIKNARTFYRSLVGNKYMVLSNKITNLFCLWGGGGAILLQARVTFQLIYTGT